MSTTQGAERLLEQIRARLKAKKEAGGSAQQVVAHNGSNTRDKLHDLRGLCLEIAACNQSHAAVGTINPRRGGPVNALIQLFKKALRRSLTWYTRPLHQFNGAVTRSLNENLAAIESLYGAIEYLNALQPAYQKALEPIYHRLGSVEHRLGSVEGNVQVLEETRQFWAKERLAEKLRSTERSARRLAFFLESKARNGDESSATRPTLDEAGTLDQATDELDFDYFVFEERFRGGEADIKNRQKAYLPYFSNRQNVLDLGCGRGEFLELLREQGITAKGVESGLDAFLLCRAKSLDVTRQNLFSYLEGLPDSSLGGIFSAQVIEHLPARLQLRMVALSYRKLAPGAVLVIETINPECVSALVRNYYLDLTHVRPMHPETLKFACESLQYQQIEVRFSSALTDQQIPKVNLPIPKDELTRFHEGLDRLNNCLFGFQDYAVIARK